MDETPLKQSIFIQDSEPFPQVQRKVGGNTCGECHIKPGETCDVCGALEPEQCS